MENTNSQCIRFHFPFFYRWIKVSAVSDPSFIKAKNATRQLYKFMASATGEEGPVLEQLLDDTEFFRPSARMLSEVVDDPQAVPVDIPPLDHHAPFEDAIRAGNGEFIFAAENKVLFFGDNILRDG
jgi:hypothetical protein